MPKTPFPQHQGLFRAALAGDAHACYRLACLCLEGEFPPWHRDVAIPLLERAAEKGHAAARERLLLETSSALVETAPARRFESRRESLPSDVSPCEIPPPPPPSPLEELTDRAHQGETGAQRRLARLYAAGDGVPRDWGRAALWWRRAAENGDAPSQVALGHCFRLGRGVARDAAACASWFRQSAEQGFADGQCNTGWCYGTAFGVPLSYATARRWYDLAAAQGHELARRNSLAVQQAFARVFAAASLALDQEGFSVAPDQTLEVNRRKCCIYIRDQHRKYHDGGTTSYRYHLCNCGTIRDMAARGKKDRYIATARCDGLFAVTPLRGPHDRREDTREMPLRLCQHCLRLLRERDMYPEPFSLRAFHARFQPPLPSWAEELEQRLVGDGWDDGDD